MFWIAGKVHALLINIHRNLACDKLFAWEDTARKERMWIIYKDCQFSYFLMNHQRLSYICPGRDHRRMRWIDFKMNRVAKGAVGQFDRKRIRRKWVIFIGMCKEFIFGERMICATGAATNLTNVICGYVFCFANFANPRFQNDRELICSTMWACSCREWYQSTTGLVDTVFPF